MIMILLHWYHLIDFTYQLTPLILMTLLPRAPVVFETCITCFFGKIGNLHKSQGSTTFDPEVVKVIESNLTFAKQYLQTKVVFFFNKLWKTNQIFEYKHTSLL